MYIRRSSRANGKSSYTKRYLNKLRRDMRGCCLLLIINHSESSRFRYITCRIHIFPFYLPWDYNILSVFFFFRSHFKVNLYLFNLKAAEKGTFHPILPPNAIPFLTLPTQRYTLAFAFREVNYDVEIYLKSYRYFLSFFRFFFFLL